jgi:hypothetical protein
MAKKKIAPKKQKKQKMVVSKRVAAKKVAPKAKLIAKKKPAAKSKAVVKAKAAIKSKAAVKSKVAAKPKRKPITVARTTQVGSQSVETVQLKPKRLAARAGAGGGDFGGVSTVEGVDSESASELLEEGQAFEAGIVSGVEDASNADEAEVTTHEVPQDDVPGEYDGKDRP